MGEAIYDTIGRDYAGRRRADPALAAAIWHALGDARSVVNVGAGAGSYEPADREVVAVEPSAVMRAQRPPGAAPVTASGSRASTCRASRASSPRTRACRAWWLAELRATLGDAHTTAVPIPHYCTDGLLGAYWRRPTRTSTRRSAPRSRSSRC